MLSSSFKKYAVLQPLWLWLFKIIILALMLQPAAADNVQAAVPEIGVSAYPFDMSQVTLGTGRLLDNQIRALNYLKWIDVDRLLYNFRLNHKLSTRGAAQNGGWDAPDFPFRSHVQGHFLTAWAQCYAVLRDTGCRDRAIYMVSELAKCQANNKVAGYAEGYLSGFPESEFTALENRTLTNGNVPYYAMHKTLAGLIDVWSHIGDTTARSVLLSLAQWVDRRTSQLSYSQMQTMMSTEFGGMNAALADIYYLTGDMKWLAAAQRFDHAAVFDPLAVNADQLDKLHANTQVPKWIGAVREYKASGIAKYQNIARNAWNITISAHTYAIGGNSQAEHFHAPNAIATYLTNDTAEACNTYNMLKLTRELWVMNPDLKSTSYFDFYERALLNHLLGQQDPASDHGRVTYFTPLNPGGKRGVGPAWGGGTWTTDYQSFWCCHGTSLETNTKLMDSIYWRDQNSASLYVNLFAPSVLKWTERNLIITQMTSFPVSDTVQLKVNGGDGQWTINIRIPSWTSSPEISVNGTPIPGLAAQPGTYASIARFWNDGDVVTLRLPMRLRTIPANDNPNIAAVAFGPVVLSGNYGSSNLSSIPTIALDSIRRTSSTKLDFTATAGDRSVKLGPFYDAQGFNYNVYWATKGSFA